MVNMDNWQAPQWIIAGLFALGLVFSFMRHGQPKIKQVNEKGEEVNADALDAVYRAIITLSLLVWGGFFS